MRPFFARALPMLTAALVAGCSASPKDGNDSPAASPTPIVTALQGRVVDLAGKPVGAARVLLCGTACQPAVADTAGAFRFEAVVTASAYHLDVRADASKDARGFVPVVVALSIASGILADVGSIALPETGTAATLSKAQSVAVDDKLSVVVDPSTLTLPSGVNAPFLAGVRVPEKAWPKYVLPSGAVVAMWAFNPFGASSSKPLEIHIADAFGLSPGRSVSLYVLRAETGLLARTASARVTADGGAIQSLPGQGMDRVTWLIVATE